MKPLLILTAAACTAFAQMTVKVQPDRISIDLKGQPYTDFIFKGGEAMKPYLYPLRAPSGTIVTRRFPLEIVAGEPTDHPHHRGLFFAHANVNGIDFWNNETSYKSPPPRGRIVFEKLLKSSGGASVMLSVQLGWLDPDGKKILSEVRTFNLRCEKTACMTDVVTELTATAPVVFGDEKDGTFGLRLDPALQENKVIKEGGVSRTYPGTPGVITNAEGVQHEKEVWGKPSHWVDYSGEIGSEKLGVAILDHPGNSRPARWHVRAYGLFAANPFGYGTFTNDKTNDGSVKLEPGQTLRFAYTVVVHSGDAQSAGIGKMWDGLSKNTSSGAR
jgi:Methane oxygenase PmoA